MKQLEYPFDSNYILQNRKKIKKQLLEENPNFLEKKVAVLGGYTTAGIVQILDLFLLNYGIKAEFYESEYNKFYEDAMFSNTSLKEFAPDIIYLCTSNKNILQYPEINADAKQIETMLSNEYQKYEDIWNKLRQDYNCPIIQNNFEMPLYRLMGNKDVSDIHGKGNYLNRLNDKFYEYAQNNANFYICDINYLSADYGLSKWSDPFFFYMYKYALNLNAVPYLAFNIARIIKSIFGKNKKGFVLDLDNTLWGGVIGDDGVEGLKLGPEEAEGQAYMDFQKYLKEHKQLGIILNIDSKNEYENAIAGLKHNDSCLSPEDFISIKANWQQKDINFMNIAKELDLLPESLVFVDDNPAERHIVSEQIKAVSAPELSSPEHYIETIDRNGYFEITTFSKDDIKRNEMYKENIQRAKLQASFSNYKEYLLSLDMSADIHNFEALYYDRISQLSNKSNQFNLTTKRYTVNQIKEISEDKDYITLYGKLSDRFGDNGLVSVVIGHIIDNICHIDLWIMSCRVLKRDMEYAMMDSLAAICKKRNIEEVKAYYYPTAKNSMVKDFYSLMGFDKINEDDKGNTIWSMSVKDYINKNEVIKVNE